MDAIDPSKPTTPGLGRRAGRMLTAPFRALRALPRLLADTALWQFLHRHTAVLGQCWTSRREGAPPKRDPIDREFLPAALEILESPPPPLPRVMLATICLIFVVTLVWSILGRLDIVAVAPGQVIASDQVRSIQSAEAAMVLAVAVVDGQQVRAGDLLVSFDMTLVEEEVAKLEAEAAKAKASLAGEGSDTAGSDPIRSSQRYLADRHAQTIERLDRARRRAGVRRILSPIDGVVYQVSVQGRGDVVTPAQELMKVVPTDGELALEAILPNTDVGFVQPGQEVSVKVESYPYTDYGTITGTVLVVAPKNNEIILQQEVKIKQRIVENLRDLGNNDYVAKHELLQAELNLVEARRKQMEFLDSVQFEKRGPRFQCLVRLPSPYFMRDGRRMAVLPGMAVTAEIRIGSRRAIDYLLGPITEHLHDSARER